MTHESSAAVDFLVRLRKLDKAGVTHRDVITLYTIIANPGVNGQEAGKMMGISDRSNIQMGLARLERKGLIEDRRVERIKSIPSIFHATPAGIAFWNDIKP